jgi:thymidylate synthase ThyX
MAFSARVLADSLSPDGVRLTTLEVNFPRIVLAEFNTHRMFSRNSASSRAIPVKTMLQRVTNDPFIPIWFGKNQKGMEAEVELDPMAKMKAEAEWLRARDSAVRHVERLQMEDIDLHKQIANRILEPWLWHTVIVTATEWDNFRGLRCHKAAQPEMRRGAEHMVQALDASKPKQLDYEQWHLPLLQPTEFVLPKDSPEWNEAVPAQCHLMTPEYAVKVCSGRCARVSYLTHDGKHDPEADIQLHDRLLGNGHMSPFEHCARPMTRYDVEVMQAKFSGVNGIDKLDLNPAQHFLGNFRGWVQYRKLLAFESNFLARPAQ